MREKRYEPGNIRRKPPASSEFRVGLSRYAAILMALAADALGIRTKSGKAAFNKLAEPGPEPSRWIRLLGSAISR